MVFNIEVSLHSCYCARRCRCRQGPGSATALKVPLAPHALHSPCRVQYTDRRWPARPWPLVQVVGGLRLAADWRLRRRRSVPILCLRLPFSPMTHVDVTHFLPTCSFLHCPTLPPPLLLVISDHLTSDQALPSRIVPLYFAHLPNLTSLHVHQRYTTSRSSCSCSSLINTPPISTATHLTDGICEHISDNVNNSEPQEFHPPR